MAEKDIEKEIEKIKVRLEKLEKHVESCDEHEEEEGHGDKRGKTHQAHIKKS